MVKPTTDLTVLSLVVSHDWAIHQLDVKKAFLHGNLFETIYAAQPAGFEDPLRPDFVYHLNKSLYGIKQSPPPPELGIVASPPTWCLLASTTPRLMPRCSPTSTGDTSSTYFCTWMTLSSQHPPRLFFGALLQLFRSFL
jgi:hypothetical protein